MVKPSGHFKGGTSLSLKVYAECGDYIAIGIEENSFEECSNKKRFWELV